LCRKPAATCRTGRFGFSVPSSFGTAGGSGIPCTFGRNGRFGFSAERTGTLWLPGLADKSRLLGRELVAGAFEGVRGAIRAPAQKTRRPLIPALCPLPAPRAA
jgi:hypothetical protein